MVLNLVQIQKLRNAENDSVKVNTFGIRFNPCSIKYLFFKCLLLVVLSAIHGQECFDFELAESDFPFDHLADFTADEDIGQKIESSNAVQAKSAL